MEIIHIPYPLGVFDQRPDWTDYFLDIAYAVSRRSTCERLSVGCVITQGNRIVSTGYNGASPGAPHCNEIGCFIEDGHCVNTKHAEMNAVEFLGPYTKFLNAYITHRPCKDCEDLLLRHNIRKVIYINEYPF